MIKGYGFLRKAWPTARTALGRPIFWRSTDRNGFRLRGSSKMLAKLAIRNRLNPDLCLTLPSDHFILQEFLARKRVWYFSPKRWASSRTRIRSLRPRESWDSLMELRLPGVKISSSCLAKEMIGKDKFNFFNSFIAAPNWPFPPSITIRSGKLEPLFLKPGVTPAHNLGDHLKIINAFDRLDTKPAVIIFIRFAV